MSLYHHAGLQRTHPDLNANFVSKTIMSSCSDKVVEYIIIILSSSNLPCPGLDSQSKHC